MVIANWLYNGAKSSKAQQYAFGTATMRYSVVRIGYD